MEKSIRQRSIRAFLVVYPVLLFLGCITVAAIATAYFLG